MAEMARDNRMFAELPPLEEEVLFRYRAAMRLAYGNAPLDFAVAATDDNGLRAATLPTPQEEDIRYLVEMRRFFGNNASDFAMAASDHRVGAAAVLTHKDLDLLHCRGAFGLGLSMAAKKV